MRTRTNKIPVYINGSRRYNRTGESINDKIHRLKRQLGPIQVIQHSVTILGIERIITESEITEYTNLGITVSTTIIEIKR